MFDRVSFPWIALVTQLESIWNEWKGFPRILSHLVERLREISLCHLVNGNADDDIVFFSLFLSLLLLFVTWRRVTTSRRRAPKLRRPSPRRRLQVRTLRQTITDVLPTLLKPPLVPPNKKTTKSSKESNELLQKKGKRHRSVFQILFSKWLSFPRRFLCFFFYSIYTECMCVSLFRSFSSFPFPPPHQNTSPHAPSAKVLYRAMITPTQPWRLKDDGCIQPPARTRLSPHPQ